MLLKKYLTYLAKIIPIVGVFMLFSPSSSWANDPDEWGGYNVGHKNVLVHYNYYSCREAGGGPNCTTGLEDRPIYLRIWFPIASAGSTEVNYSINNPVYPHR